MFQQTDSEEELPVRKRPTPKQRAEAEERELQRAVDLDEEPDPICDCGEPAILCCCDRFHWIDP